MNWVSFSHLPRPHVDYMCSINATWKSTNHKPVYIQRLSLYLLLSLAAPKKLYSAYVFFPSLSFRVHVKSASFFCQSTCLVESGRAKISIASFVVVPSAVEIDRAVQYLLKHCPPSTACFLDLKYIECTGIVRIDCINTADSLSSFVECSTVQSCRLKMKGKDITKKNNLKNAY